jgi:methyl-accepting chemotaxis protein
MQLKNVKIGKRLVGGYAIFTAIILLLCTVSLINMRAVGTMASDITHINFQKAILANSIPTHIQALNKEQVLAIAEKDKSRLAAVGEKRKLYLAAIENLEKLETEKDGKNLLAKLKETAAAGREGSAKLSKALEEGNFDEALNTLTTVNAPITAKIIDVVGELIQYQENGVRAKYNRILQNNKSISLMLIIMGTVSIILCVLITIIVTRSITVPIQKNISIAKTLAEGNLSIHVDVDRKDEFGDELSAFKTMVDKWKRLIAEVKTSANSVASASRELSTSAEQLSKGATAQVEKTLQVSTASEEMSQTSLDIAKNTNDIAESAKTMVSTAEKGSSIGNKSVDEVKEIAKTVQKSSEFVKDLGSQSDKIGEIINVINEIADQTNLLALNAAIEAARAGDAGRGFAVVADEVKKLAERTGHSTKEIGDMISSIRSGVEKAVKSMDEASQSVKAGVELSNQAGTALNEIVGSSSSLQSMLQQIAAAIEEMNATTDEIARDIEEVASVTQESSNSAEQVTQSAMELSSLSIKLEDSVKEFKLETL